MTDINILEPEVIDIPERPRVKTSLDQLEVGDVLLMDFADEPYRYTIIGIHRGQERAFHCDGRFPKVYTDKEMNFRKWVHVPCGNTQPSKSFLRRLLSL